MNLRICSQLVVHGDDPDCLAARDQRDVEPGPCTEPARLLLVDLRIVEQRVDPRTLASLQNPAALRVRTAQAVADERFVELDAVCGGDQQVALGRRVRERDHRQSRADQVSEPCTDELEEVLQLHLLDERADDLVQRLELA